MKEDIERVVRASVDQILKENSITDLDLLIEVGIPKNKDFGDFSVNTAMVLAKVLGKKPRDIAELIINNLPEEHETLFNKVEIAGAGFVNFYVKEGAVVEKLLEIDRLGGDFGRVDIGQGEKVLVEFVSANPTGYLHMGHARNAVVGDTIANILSHSGYDVTREFYINDAGRQVEMLGRSVYARYLELCGQQAELPEDGYKGDYVVEIARELKEQDGDKYLTKTEHYTLSYFTQYAKTRLIGEITADLDSIGVKFDNWYSESENLHRGDQNKIDEIKRELDKRGVLEEKEGALWFKATDFGDTQDWVVIKSDGSPTYFLADIAYHYDKYVRGYERLINVWGADHHSHIARLRAALRALGYGEQGFDVLLIQFVRLVSGGQEVAMSKRSGSYVTMRDVVGEVGPDVLRFFMLMRSSDTHLDFDIELAKQESNENPVFYIQYAHARIESVLRKAKEEGSERAPDHLDLLTAPEELSIIKKLLQFPEAIGDSAQTLAPHKVVYYLGELASEFHNYYNKYRVLVDDDELSSARLYLIICIQTVFRNGLKLLGIDAPERM